MKYTQLFLSTLVATALVSCKEEPAETPKVTYDAAKVEKPAPKVDTAQIEVADLPIHIPGTNYLIHPVGDLNIYGSSKPKYDASSAAATTASFQISNYDEGEITGYLRNLKFQQIGTDSIVALSDKPLLIQSVKFLKTVAEKTKQQIIVYTLADMDTNQDGKLDVNDIKSLYLSEMGGAKLTKMSADMQELIDWNLIESQNRLYFRTIEDTNKNGEFDKNDVVHYHYIDLLGDWKVLDYKPI
ncbi:CREC-EF hand family protein [Flavobacterium caeni]|uniref:EF-hand domain-containing protein n=1 Tax=Flavobacterium caeni TaxID=490189 RepID=A0A1G5HM11_9FLAO|nr:hypothetical protein [Flavobacterium caeni]SCY64905.1 hypothetical protein SAMN02927903_01912 [Flavobacterium caeni]